VHKKLGEDTARTTDLNRPKGFSIPCDIVLSSKSWGVTLLGLLLLGDWLGSSWLVISNYFVLF